MQFIPGHCLSALEFDKIQSVLQGHCLGPYAFSYFEDIPFLSDANTINRQLQEVSEYKKIQESTAPLQLADYASIIEDITQLKTEGYVLNIEALQRIDLIIKNVDQLFHYFKGERKKIYPALFLLIKDLSIPEELKLGLEKILDKNGDIKADASPTLLQITKSLARKSTEINQQFNRLSQKYRQLGWLSETIESYRNGRRVLSAPAEYKRKIRGIIHDESASGKTVYIEPEEIISLNNDYFDLESDYRKEVYQILKELSNQMRPFRKDIRRFYELIGYFDTIQARATLAIKMRGQPIQVLDKAHIGFIKAYHPLLLLKNEKLGLKTVAFDMELHKRNKIVVLSGPNAGGKSISLKAVGLLQLMVQAGMLIPADQNSKVGVFKKLFADIGDQQSLEDDLSTYSSRLSNMKAFLENADKDTLFLIDEFGSGTDPQIGGAIAEAILRALNQSKAYGVVTTHYSNLKFYAFKTHGIINASMLFDKKRFEPTYELILGKPGSSFAFEIAQKTGLDKSILKYARFKTGKNVKKIEDLVIELQSEKQELESRLSSIDDKENQLDKLIKNYDSLHRDLDYKRKKLKLEKKELSIIDLNKYNRELEMIIKEIKENQKLDKALELSRKIKEERESSIQDAELLEEQVMESSRHDWKDLKVGDYVKLKSGGQSGQILSIRNKKAELEMGLLKMTVKLSDLIPTKEPIRKIAGVTLQTEFSNYNSKFEPKIDIRGYSKSDASDTLQEFLDNAILANASFLQILHGKGNGVLRNLVKEKLREYRDVDTVTHPSEENGGNGITLVTLK